MRFIGALAMVAVLAAGHGRLGAVEVVLDFVATVETVRDEPFGLKVPRGTRVSGAFVYETGAATDSNASEERGDYQLASSGAFRARFLGHEVVGSATPFLEVQNIGVGGGDTIDTFRFSDGDEDSPRGGVMAFDGVADGEIALWLSITDGAGASFDDDDLPALFPMQMRDGGGAFPHTFSLQDGRGLMLLQFESLLQRLPNTLRIVEVAFEIPVPSLLFHSQPDVVYSVEFSTDFVIWRPIGSVPSQGYLTEFADSGLASREGGVPASGYYRVREPPS